MAGLAYIDLSGQRRGRLLIVAPLFRSEKDIKAQRAPKWICECDCGNITSIAKSSLCNPNGTMSCGCITREKARSRLSTMTQANILPPGQAARNQIVSTYKKNATKRNRKWNLSEKELDILFAGNCHYCGAKPWNKRVTEYSSLIYNGIDRIDSNKGYVPENVVSCCGRCNRAKYTLSYEEFIGWILEIRANKTFFTAPTTAASA